MVIFLTQGGGEAVFYRFLLMNKKPNLLRLKRKRPKILQLSGGGGRKNRENKRGHGKVKSNFLNPTEHHCWKEAGRGRMHWKKNQVKGTWRQGSASQKDRQPKNQNKKTKKEQQESKTPRQTCCQTRTNGN